MKLKKISILLPALLAFTACNLDYFPETGYSEHDVIKEDGDSDVQYQTREDILGARNAMYNNIKSTIQESGLSDLLIYTEVFADNAYCGSTSTAEIVALENFSHDGANKNVQRDWSFYLSRVSDANQIITYIDGIEDPALTDAERAQWKAEAMIWRAWNWFTMGLLWGDIPMVDLTPPVITADNIEEVWPYYFPTRTDLAVVYARAAEDLEWAAEYAPAIDAADKFKMSKTLAYGLLAKIYAEEPIRDYSKVDEYCGEVEKTGVSLVADFDDLWAWNDEVTDVKLRHSSESIFEVPYTPSSGHWVWMMFWRNWIGANRDDSFSWAKWVCPARNLIEAYEAEGDNVRYNASIVWDQPTWSTRFYPSSNYPFVYKLRTNASSIIKMRLAEIYLLHAEALAQLDDLGGAADYVDMVRNRVGLGSLAASAKASKESMLDAILHERRLELAFEGQRWFDLKRLGKAVECVNNRGNLSSQYYDSYKPVVQIDDRRLLLPVPVDAIDSNSALEQNPGF